MNFAVAFETVFLLNVYIETFTIDVDQAELSL